MNEIGIKGLLRVEIDSEGLKFFENYGNELNQSKLAPNGQNQYRMNQNVLNDQNSV